MFKLLFWIILIRVANARKYYDSNNNHKCGFMSNRPSSPNCATTHSSQSIVGGMDSQHFWPWHALLTNSKRQSCGGSLISPNLILTAAHCIKRLFNDSNPRAYLRLSYLQETRTIGNYWQSALISHVGSDGYNNVTHDNDIALVLMADQAPDYIQPICLPEPNEELMNGEGCYVAGFGKTLDNSTQYRRLKEICLPIVPTAECSKFYEGQLDITTNMFCAGYEEHGKDTCVGDSGGALVCKKGDIWKVFGLVSVGTIDCGTGIPGLFTNVRNFVPILKQKIYEINPDYQ